MAISKKLDYSHVDNLQLDPQNPRIGRLNRKKNLDQNELLQTMSKWTLDELVDSFLTAGGFWTQDALIVVKEPIDGVESLVVVEGNRRLAALKLMLKTVRGQIDPPRWLKERLAERRIEETDELFVSIPYLVAESRTDVSAYLGFRHVTGIKEWAPTEKAEFITRLIEEQGLSYKEVAKQIGSRTDFIRQNYVAYKILLQIEANWDKEKLAEVEDKFSVLFLSLRSEGVRSFIGVDLRNTPEGAHDPIPEYKKKELGYFIDLLFGSKQRKPIVKDSRQVDRFGEILAEPRAVRYLMQTAEPQFEVAYSLTKGGVDLVVEPLREARRQISLALSEIAPRAEEPIVRDEAWPVIEGGISLAHITKGENLKNAREALGAD